MASKGCDDNWNRSAGGCYGVDVNGLYTGGITTTSSNLDITTKGTNWGAKVAHDLEPNEHTLHTPVARRRIIDTSKFQPHPTKKYIIDQNKEAFCIA